MQTRSYMHTQLSSPSSPAGPLSRHMSMQRNKEQSAAQHGTNAGQGPTQGSSCVKGVPSKTRVRKQSCHDKKSLALAGSRHGTWLNRSMWV